MNFDNILDIVFSIYLRGNKLFENDTVGRVKIEKARRNRK